MKRTRRQQWVLQASALALATFVNAGLARAQAPAADAAQATANTVENIVVLGSQIRGAKTTGALPVSVVGAEAIQATAAVSAGDLFRTIPQVGDIQFNEQATGGQNATRGDVSSVSLRGLGLGNTLLLVNGRRMVIHPTSQAVTGIVDSQVPVYGYNSNSVPVSGLERLEVLRDGAAALYGSDAVAGVVNNVLKSNFNGQEFSVQLGGQEDTSQTEFEANGTYGKDFLDGRLNVSLFGSYSQRSRLYTNDIPYLASSDRSRLAVGTPFEGNASFDGRSSSSAWGVFQAPSSLGTIRSNGVAVTSATAQFHVQPSTNPGCQIASATPGVCFDDGNITTAVADRNTRLDSNATFRKLSTLPETRRLNLFSFINYKISDDLTFFGELGLYQAVSSDVGGSGGVGATTPITISPTAYWNPFGAATLANGQPNPNRLPGLNIPLTGVSLIPTYNIVDAGVRETRVKNAQYRILGGLRGTMGDWDWESALLYNWATASDSSDAQSNTLFQQALNRTTPDAYNPFTGGDPLNPSIGDSSPNSQAIIDSFMIKAIRKDKTTLTLADFKVSNANLFDLWGGGNVGVAAGVEWRRETIYDNRPPSQDGTTTYTDSVTGIKYPGDILNSQTLDLKAKRTVFSAYSELAVAVVTPEMGIPLVRAIDLQLAGRYEKYSDIGSVAKPKVAASWDPFDGVRLRTSWSQGFRAPNLEVINQGQVERSVGGRDYVMCEADLRAKRIATFSACNRPATLIRQVAGNRNLGPEESESFSYGAVLTPPLPPEFGRVTFTVDRWKIEQANSVGLINAQDLVNLDYLLRVRGSSLPAVRRQAPTADDIAAVAGTGLAPVGQLINIAIVYENLLPITVEGLDLNLDYRLRGASLGNFSVSISSSKTLRYYQAPNEVGVTLAAGQAAGQINAGVPLTAGGDFVGKNGRPKWRHTVNLTWSKGPLQIGSLIRYTDNVAIIDVLDANNNPYPVKSQTLVNFYGTYNFDDRDNLLSRSSVTLGVRNAFDKDPPLTPSGYLAALYQPQGRYWYLNVKKSF